METEILQGITLIHGDNMEFMRSLPDNAFDLAIADPPYGDAKELDKAAAKKFNKGARSYNYTEEQHGRVSIRSGGGYMRRYADEGRLSADLKWDVAPPKEYFDELRRVSRNQIIWGANYFPYMPATRCFVVWRKRGMPETFSMAMCEYAWTSFDRNALCYEYPTQGTAKNPRFHPTQKPVALYAWLLRHFCEPGQKVLDPNLGSGSIALAAHDYGCELTGVEIDAMYFAKARERIIAHQAQTRLF